MSTRKKAEGVTRQVIGQMIGDDLLVQEGKEQERKARNEDKGEDVTVQRQQSPEEQSPEEQSAKPHSRTDKGNG